LPWISVQDFPSKGTVSRVSGHKTNRVQHFLSRNELNYFYLLEWSDEVLNIREQYPLSDIALAAAAASGAGIKYPKDSISGFPYVLTCDFMITSRKGLKARTIKLSSELCSRRTIEKLEIERRYWQELGIDWNLITEHEIPIQKVRNIEWLHTSATLPENLANPRLQIELLKRIQAGYPIIHIVNAIDEEFTLPVGSGLKIFKHLLWKKWIACEMGTEIRLSERFYQTAPLGVMA